MPVWYLIDYLDKTGGGAAVFSNTLVAYIPVCQLTNFYGRIDQTIISIIWYTESTNLIPSQTLTYVPVLQKNVH